MKIAVSLFVTTFLCFAALYGEIVIRHEDSRQMIIDGSASGNAGGQIEDEGFRYVNAGSGSHDTIRGLIASICREQNMDHRLIEAVVQVESRFQPYAVSRVGAMGLMQLMPDTADRLGVKNPFDIQENISAGVRYLKYLHGRFGGNLEYALAAYNAGPTAVEMYNGIPPYPETMRYVDTIMSLFRDAGGISAVPGDMKVKKDAAGLTITNNIYKKGR